MFVCPGQRIAKLSLADDGLEIKGMDAAGRALKAELNLAGMVTELKID